MITPLMKPFPAMMTPECHSEVAASDKLDTHDPSFVQNAVN